jgi:hypothetical protein
MILTPSPIKVGKTERHIHECEFCSEETNNPLHCPFISKIRVIDTSAYQYEGSQL